MARNQNPDQPESLVQPFRKWLHLLLSDPMAALSSAATWIIGAAVGLFLVVLFARIGRDLIRGAWK